jgi:methionyl-tRNA formyltransferase
MILQRWVGIRPEDTSGSLAARLAEVGAPLLADSLRLAHEGRAPRVPQDRAAGSYAPRLAKRDGEIDWAADVVAVWNRQRSATPWPGAVTAYAGRRVQITRAEPLHALGAGVEPGSVTALGREGIDVACGRGVLRVLRLKAEGKPEMPATDWARGARVREGERFVAEEGGTT